MKIEVGMYARTLNGIVQIDKIQDNVMKDTKGYLHYGDFIKASYNIIDLIEVGDYVNGSRISTTKNGKPTVEYDDPWYNIEFENEDIKTIVTKEQFEANSYKVGE